MKTALLLSGGIESTILAYEYRPDIAVTINYGQISADSEVKASTYICKELGIKHIILDVDILQYFNKQLEEWIPYRNQYLLTLSAMVLAKYNVSELLIGTINTDKIHPDGTEEFIKSINNLFMIDKPKIQVKAPFIMLTSDQLIERTNIPLSLLGIVHSCTVSNLPCNECNSCKKYYDFFSKYKNAIKVI
ncbi:MAG: 7-cyano-7-deazaguanine synthase [Sulfurimonadaceae bacterium]